MNLKSDLQKVITAGADILHLDVMDGHFVPNLTFGTPIIKMIKDSFDIPLDVHLMVNNPLHHINFLTEIGVQYISFHQETVAHIHRYIQTIKDADIKAGIALNPSTPIDTIFPVLDFLDFVLIMSVNPGFGGQNFLPLAISKIEKLKKRAQKYNPEMVIEVDGGINDRNVIELVKAGASIIVAGSYIFKSGNYQKQINSLKLF